MKCVILCAGYGTRLGKLTENTPKPLLPVAGRPMVDYILDRLAEAGITSGVLVTNHRFYEHFVRWAGSATGSVELQIVDDGTTSNETRLGAIGDLDLGLRAADIREDFIVVNGDNLFTFSLSPIVSFFREKGNTIVLYDVGSKDVARQMGIAETDEQGRVVGFVEKPADPPSTCVSIGIYLYQAGVRDLIRRYLEQGNPADRTGDFVAWLYRQTTVYGYFVDRAAGIWYDIGTPEQYYEADRLMAELRSGGGDR